MRLTRSTALGRGSTTASIEHADAGYDRLEARIDDLHPYDVPCIERFDEDDALNRFAAWLDDSVA